MHLIARNKGKEPIVPNDVDAPADNELSSNSSSSLGLSPVRNKRAKSGKRPSHHPASSIPLVVHSVGQGEKRAGGKANKIEFPITRQYGPLT